MAQIDNTFTAYFLDSTTAPGSPLTSLSATINIREVATWTLVINTQAMTNIGWWNYTYLFASYDKTKDYVYECNPNSALSFRQSGVTDRRQDYLDKSISDAGGRAWWASFDTTRLSWFDTKLKDIWDEIKKLSEKEIVEKELDLSIVIDKIESIPKIDISEVMKSVGTLKMQITKLSEFIRKGVNEEKDEMKSEYESKIAEMSSNIDDIEGMFNEFKGISEKEKKTLLSSKEQEIKEIMDFAEEAVQFFKEWKDNAVYEAGKWILNKLKNL